MPSSYLSWAAAVELFERRGLARETYRDLYEEEYILHPGAARVTGELSLDDHDGSPWCADTPDQATGYVIDGDLTVEGNIVNVDDGAAALVVLGNLRAANVLLEGDVKLVVLGDVEVETFVGNWTDKLVKVHGDLRTAVTILWNEFRPDLVAGTLRGRVLAPRYMDLTDLGAGGLEDPGPEVPLSALMVPEVLVDGEPGPDDFAEIGVRSGALRERLSAGLPLIRGGRAVPAASS
ncbi:hypothetical protein ABZ470_21790 [Streptosporangium sp. NPDC020072]|uniref:hypothetical protein n=1 Tax=Streptosporangium sp. NPDC020072 TaxID=3154788 RepID=UPI00342A1EA5